MKPIIVMVVVIVLCLSLAPVGGIKPANAFAPTLEAESPSGRFFTQANGFPLGTSPKGFWVVNDAKAPMWNEYQRLGGVLTLGYPVSRRFKWDRFECQAFQKGVLQWRSEEERASLANVFDLISAAGKDEWLLSKWGVPRQLPAGFDEGKAWDDIVQSRIALLEVRPAIRDAYFNVEAPLHWYGLPTSRAEDIGPAYVIRLQRAVLQEWKAKTPWAEAGQVTIANGGDLTKDAGLMSFLSGYPEDPPSGFWNPASGLYKATGEATWYGQPFHGRAMANGQIYDMRDATTLASNMYPLGTKLKVTNEKTKANIVGVVKDTGAFTYPIVVDLSHAAFGQLANVAVGRIPVSVEVLPP
jgi:hypothetical protein